MKSIFKLYIFKLVILSLAMIFISFGASAKKLNYFTEELCDKLQFNSASYLVEWDEARSAMKKDELLSAAHKLGMLYQVFCKKDKD